MPSMRDTVELLIQSDDVLTPSLLGAIATAFDQMQAETLVQMNKADLAIELVKKGIFDAVPGGDRNKAVQVAGCLQTALVAAGVSGQKVSSDYAPSSPVPIQVTVTQEKSLANMRLPELLAYVALHADDAEARHELVARDIIGNAYAITNAWVIPNATGDIDVAKTLKYLAYLNKSGAAPQRRYEDAKPVTLERALGIMERALVNPLMDGAIVEGMDEYGNDWREVTPELMEAVYWARITRHRLFPPTIDPVNHFAELTAQPLPRRWSHILEDYQSAREEDDPTAVISLTIREGSPANQSHSTSQSHTTHQAVSVEMLVRNLAQGYYRASGDMTSISGVFTDLEINGDMVNLDVTVLDRIRINGDMAKGTVRTLPGTRWESNGDMNNSQRIIMSWEQLAVHLGIQHSTQHAGAIAMGQDTVAVGQGGVAIRGNVYGSIITR